MKAFGIVALLSAVESAWLFGFVLLLAGCASFNAPSMSPEQLKEATKDKSLAVACLTFTGTGGSGQSVIITYDQRAISNGGVAVDPRNGCSVNLTNMAKPATAEPAK